MSKFEKTSVALALALLIGAVPLHAEDVTPVQQQTQEQIYGSQLMTQQERVEYRARMRNATSAQERQQIRLEHHQAMQLRAQQQGVTLAPFGSGPGLQGSGPRVGGGQGGGQRMGGGR